MAEWEKMLTTHPEFVQPDPASNYIYANNAFFDWQLNFTLLEKFGEMKEVKRLWKIYDIKTIWIQIDTTTPEGGHHAERDSEERCV